MKPFGLFMAAVTAVELGKGTLPYGNRNLYAGNFLMGPSTSETPWSLADTFINLMMSTSSATNIVDVVLCHVLVRVSFRTHKCSSNIILTYELIRWLAIWDVPDDFCGCSRLSHSLLGPLLLLSRQLSNSTNQAILATGTSSYFAGNGISKGNNAISHIKIFTNLLCSSSNNKSNHY